MRLAAASRATITPSDGLSVCQVEWHLPLRVAAFESLMRAPASASPMSLAPPDLPGGDRW